MRKMLLLGLLLALGCGPGEAIDEPSTEADAGVDTNTDTEPESDATDSPGDSCAFAEDGTCDEPVNCELGTDSTDCVTACESGENLHLFAAACAHRNPPEEADREGADPSEGTSTETGWFDRTATIPSGVDGSGVARHFRVFVPPTYDPERPYPLVINMPGHRVGHEIMANHTQLPRSADLNDFIVVFAEQEFRQGRWAWWTDWNWAERTDENPDFEFLQTIVDDVARDYNVDLNRVIASGHSRGAAMAFIAAMEMPDTIAGAVVESGFTEFGYLDVFEPPEKKVPLVFIHGVLDDDVCIDCRPGVRCAVDNRRVCSNGLHSSDAIVEKLEELGWTRDEDLVYHRLEDVAHRWQTQLNQQWWDFLEARPNDGGRE